jgi:hypothetical protein
MSATAASSASSDGAPIAVHARILHTSRASCSSLAALQLQVDTLDGPTHMYYDGLSRQRGKVSGQRQPLPVGPGTVLSMGRHCENFLPILRVGWRHANVPKTA